MRRSNLCFSFLILCFAVKAQCISGNCENGVGARYFYGTDTVFYEGNFKNSYPEGYGVATYRFGKRYAGAWRHGLWFGNGTLTLANNQKIEGYWEYSKLKQSSATSDQRSAVSDQPSTISRQRLAISNAPLAASDESLALSNEQNIGGSKRIVQNSKLKNVTPQIWALAVGVAEYSSKSVPIIKYPDNDAFGMFAFWKSPKGGALDDDHLRILTDDAATKKAVTHNIETLFSQARSEDLAIFFFSGHGLEGSFLTTDYDGGALRLRHKEINMLMSHCAARHKLIIADACFAGGYVAAKSLRTPMQKQAASDKFYSELSNSNSGTAYFLSCAPDEESLEVNTLQNSVFSYYVIKGLNGDANINADNIITLKELFDYVYKNVTAFAQGLGKVQTPMLKGNYDLNMPVAIKD